MNTNGRPGQRRMQPYKRMRAPIEARPFVLQWHVIQAIRRSSEITGGESVYQEALEELISGSVTELLDDFGSWTKGLVSGQLQGRELESAVQILDKARKTVDFDEDYPSMVRFNRDFLNGNGELTLIYSLVIDAASVDIVALDEYRGGEVLRAAYGPRRTQAAKRIGPQIQSLLKRWASFDEPAMVAAADDYVVHRYVYRGHLPGYQRREELAGRSLSSRRRRWFRDFDNALGYPAPQRGRPPKERYFTKPPQNKAPQRKVHRSKGHRHP